ncbi:MAG TPA: phytanoyl-CoA dioxygenase family protein [Candidatus Sulfotelmatobacter sp.]|nr:phytanoyl-CoA dioxygenase family protein [Candidatus Sulfotelmatobacter sp.]
MSIRAEVNATGFALLHDVFSPEFVERTLEEIERLSPHRSRAGARHVLGLSPIANMARCRQLLDVARVVLGVEAIPFRATLFEKTLAANWLVVWHQDTAVPLRERQELQGWGPWSMKEGITYAHAPSTVLSRVLALRIHFDDSTPANGPLRVLPRTHENGVLSDDQIHDLSERITPVECVVSKGGVVAMRPLVVHASSKSQVEMPRRVLHIEYAASDSIAAPLRLASA